MRPTSSTLLLIFLLGSPLDGYAGPLVPPQVLVPAGKYIRGAGESPKEQVEITLKAYLIDQDEVTNAYFDECVKSKVCAKAAVAGKAGEPVRGVSWKDADRYCKFVHRRLPTEAEWERAAFPPAENQSGRGPLGAGSRDLCKSLLIGGHDGEPCAQKRKGPEETLLSTLAESAGELRYNDAVPVTESGPLVYDLFGNVAEWVADWFPSAPESLFYYSHPPVTVNPTGPLAGKERIIRGGSFAAKSGVSQSDGRTAPPTARLADVGFRCAAEVGDSIGGASAVSHPPPQKP